MMEFTSFGFSEIGKSHTQNEDRYFRDERQGLFLIADGMGGHVSGETASQLAIDCLSDEEILAVILSVPDRALYKIGLSLVLKASLAGGRDDTTVILIAFSE
jgi:serine/threonine protein phosphatase PrpC